METKQNKNKMKNTKESLNRTMQYGNFIFIMFFFIFLNV